MKDKGSLNLIREINTAIILGLLKEQAPLSKYDISKISGLSAPTVSNIIADLQKIGFVKELGLGESIGGRPPLLLDLDLEGGFIVGVDIGADNIKGIVVDFIGNVIAKYEQEVSSDDQEFVIFNKITTTISKVIALSGKNRSLFLGMGMGISGEVDSKNGIIRHASRLNWNNVPLKSIIESSFNLPTFIDENVKLLTIAEQWYGAGKGYSNIVCLRVGDDVGMGIIVDNKLFNGFYGNAGAHFGSVILSGNETLESSISSKAIMRKIREKTGDSSLSRVEDIARMAAEGDISCISVMDEVGQTLAGIIYNMAVCLDPQMIIIGGGISEAGDPLFKPLHKHLDRLSESKGIKINVSKSKLGADAYAIGAATTVLHRVFHSPAKFFKI